jgi:uncharacterized membrane protein YkoI
MKRTRKSIQYLALAAVLLGFLAPTTAQERQISRKGVPPAVLAAFTSAYPNATIKGFSKEKENGQTLYEVECEEGKTMRDVTFTEDGTVVSVEETVEISEVPPAVKAALDNRVPGGRIKKAEKIIKGGVITYEFQVKHNGKKIEIVYDPEGNELNFEIKTGIFG